MKNKVLLSESLLVIVTVIWGLGFPITKLAVNAGFGPYSVTLARFLVASIVLSILYRKRLKFINKTIIKYGFIAGIFLFLGFYFQTLGAIFTTPSKNGFITQLNIIFVPFLYFIFVRIRIDIHNILAVLIALFGLYMISFHQVSFNTINRGDIFTFICAILVAFHVVTSSHYQKTHDFDPPMFVLVSMITAMIFAFILIPFETIPTLTVQNVWPLIFLGIFNTAIGFLVQSYALKISHPTRVSLIVSLEGLFGAIGSVLIIKEILTVNIVFGGLLIISAILLTELKPFRKRRIEPEVA
ncbi:MAG: DMT family transporter [Candidatus Izemoplasmataceae bacterium]|jgi:drug/metabolite transporter (DMT)-like permease|uniref:DMT family transporter n=1 Tax=Liberiplasma polymorphum TaxID=3374570 RepID=UPI003771851A